METQTKIAQQAIRPDIDLILYCAASLAREGQYEAAETLLLAVPSEFATAPILDLTARIYAQKGNYIDAEKRWTEALQLDPRNEAYQQCLKTSERQKLRPVWLPWATVFGVVSLAVGLATMVTLHSSRPAQSRRMAGETQKPSPPVLAIRHEVDASFIEIPLKSPLFSHGTTLTSAGRETLREVADRIRSSPSILRVEIEGHTDSEPLKHGGRFRSNDELAIARAKASAIFLHRESGLPLSRVLLSASAAASGTRAAKDSSQRTALIRIITGIGKDEQQRKGTED